MDQTFDQKMKDFLAPERKRRRKPPGTEAVIHAEIAWWKEEKRQCKRYSSGWHRCDGAILALTDVLAKIKEFAEAKRGK